MARVVALEKEQTNLNITLACDFANELSIDQSVAHNGVCLTVVRHDDKTYTVTAIDETLRRSNLGLLQVGDAVNVERSMKLDARLDGHIVQGHVDQTAVCTDVQPADGSTVFTFHYESLPEQVAQGYFVVEKGSVTVNGVSLTVCAPTADSFSVCIIPYTLEHTNFGSLHKGSVVNLEFDIIGKYVSRLAQLH